MFSIQLHPWPLTLALLSSQHSMAAIANGLAAYLPQSASGNSGFIPVISTFFMFTLYAAPALRMAALQKLRTVTIATHDSLGIGGQPTLSTAELDT